VAAALAAWQAPLSGDDPEGGRLTLARYQALTNAGPDDRRMADQVRFFADTERAWYAEAKTFLRDELGYPGLVTSSNFPPGDPLRHGDPLRWAWSANDVVEQNDFYAVKHTGQDASWAIGVGHAYAPRSATRDGGFTVNRRQVSGKPFIVSSTSWLAPSPYRCEGPLLCAAYAAMNGVDGVLWFSCRTAGYDTSAMLPKRLGGSPALMRWDICQPDGIGMFPAAALIHRQGLVDPAPTAVHEPRALDDIVAAHPPLVPEAGKKLETILEVPAVAGSPPGEAFLRGPVTVAFGAAAAAPAIAPPLPGPGIASLNGQLRIERERGLVTIDAPRAQGAVGFLADAGEIRLRDLVLRCGNHHAAVVAVPLDGLPLAQSRQILVQVGTAARPTGWAERPAADPAKGVEITATGTMPWRIVCADVELTIANPHLTRLTPLAPDGTPGATQPVVRDGAVASVRFPAEAMYAVLE
jgi:hypothetical protein